MVKANIQTDFDKDAMASAILAHVKPTHFVTLSLCQGREVINPHGLRSRVWGDDVVYQRAFEGFQCSLSKRLSGEAAWKRGQKPLVPAVCVIEGGNKYMRAHLHIIIAKPAQTDELCFRTAIGGAAAGNPWVMNSQHAVDIQSLADEHEAMRAARYVLKHGGTRVCL